MPGWVAQMRKGLIELCVLAALRSGEAYGYQIVQTLAEIDCLATTESTIYPILARLAEEGFVKVRSAPSPSGPPRRYYQLTSLGRARLREMLEYWSELRCAIDRLSKGEGR